MGSIVQFASTANANANNATFTSPTTAGNRIVAIVSLDTGTSQIASIALTGSTDVFTMDGSAATTDPTANINLSAWSDPNCSGGHTVVTCSGTGASTLLGAFEVSGTDHNQAVTAHGSGSPASTLQSSFDSGAAASTAAGCTWIGAVTGVGSGGRAIAVPSGSWTAETALQPGSLTQMTTAYQASAAAGVPEYSGTFSAPVAGAYWAALVVAYSPATATQSGAAALSAPGALSAAGVIARRGVAHLSASPALAAPARVTEVALAHLSGLPALSAAATASRVAHAAMTGAAQLSATAHDIAPGHAALGAPAALAAPSRITVLAAVHLTALGSLAAPGSVLRLAQARLSAAPVLSARLGGAALAASGSLHAVGAVTVRAQAPLGALPSLLAEPAGSSTGALWTSYLAAQQKSHAAWEQWHMMRQAGGTDGSAGFLFGDAYEAQRAAEAAYEAWRAAQAAAHPGVTG
jgi:hypothetical protein